MRLLAAIMALALLCGCAKVAYRVPLPAVTGDQKIIADLISRLDKPGTEETTFDDLPGPYSDSDAAANDLRKYGSKATLQLISALNDINKWRRYWAAKLLGEIRDPQAIDALINELNKKTDDAGTIALSLAAIGDKRALPAMENALDLPSWVQRTGINYATGDGYSIAGSMARMGPAARPFFLHSLKSKDINRQLNAKAGLNLLNGGDGLLVQYWQDTMKGKIKYP